MAENVAASDSAAGESGNASTGSEVVRSRESQTMDESEQVKTIRPDSQTGGAERTGRDIVEEEHAGTSSGRRDVDESIPSCLLDCRDAVEACSHRAQAWADAQNEKAERKQRQRREKADGGVRVEEDGTVVEPKGDSFVQRKGIVFLVFVILTWVYIVYVWRICANGIRQAQDATATRDEAIALTVVFNVIWLWTMWSYVKVILTGPGYVRDECGIVEAPKSPKMDASQFPQHLNGTTQQNDVSTSAPMHAPTPFAPYPATATATTIEATQATTGECQDNGSTSVLSAALPVTTSVDSKLAAALGPIGVSMLARAEEAEAVQQAELRAVTPSSSMPLQQQQQPPQQPALPSSNLPEPLRLPQTTFPLHEINTYCYRCKRVKPPRSHHCRHCGTCVLKMDHHCPWVGGCVGARNHKFFYNFLQSVTVLEIFVLTSNAIMFHRGIARRPRWSIDGYMISLFPIASAFCLFTFTLLVTHTYLFVMNLSTIEHMSYDRQKVRENILIERWSEERARLDEKPAPGFFGQMRERDAMKRRWAAYWGKPKSEANLWWLDGRRSARLMGNGGEIVGDPSFTPRFAEGERTDDVLRPLSWYHGIATNWRQAMGDSPAGWLLPVGRGLNADGTKYAANWRFGPLGEWTPREQWTSRLEKSQA